MSLVRHITITALGQSLALGPWIYNPNRGTLAYAGPISCSTLLVPHESIIPKDK